MSWFQYRKRYEITCDSIPLRSMELEECSFNTASGMRSHVTTESNAVTEYTKAFQYRKRYEITCDNLLLVLLEELQVVSIPQAV